MNDYLDNRINFYKIEIAKEKQRNGAIDPFNRFPLTLSNSSEINNDEINKPSFLPVERYSLEDYQDFLRGDEDAVFKSKQDTTGAFYHYFLPISVIKESYKPVGERKKFIGSRDMLKLIKETKDLVYYKDYSGDNHIGIKGTNSLEDLKSDAAIAFSGNTDTILSNIKNDFEDIILENDKTSTYNIYGHSLGGSRASILLDRYQEKIGRIVVFNMGKSPVGWNPTAQNKLIHYHMVGDPISETNENLQKSNTIGINQPGPKPLLPNSRIQKYHGIDTFLNQNNINRLENKIKSRFSGNYFNIFNKINKRQKRQNYRPKIGRGRGRERGRGRTIIR